MGRSFFPVSYINRMVLSRASSRRQKEQDYVVSAQSQHRKNVPSTYELLSVDFDKDTRRTRIVIEETQYYRTIERYVTRNYEKHPIYSNVKERTKKINKSLKLTNIELEQLNCNDDKLIRDFAFEIINAINDENLYPSWFIIWTLRTNCKARIAKLRAEYAVFEKNNLALIAKSKKIIDEIKEGTIKKESVLARLEKCRNKLEKKITSIKEHSKSWLWIILSLGFYAYFISERRKTRIESKLSLKNEKIKIENEEKVKADNLLQQHTDFIKRKQYENKVKANEITDQIREITKETEENIQNVESLPSTISVEDKDFIPLEALSGYEYSKIVGCYVIRNREKDKYYVGQSKDVLKRLKQHFKGTVPANIIFAEDYYTSAFDDKDNLYEVKIIQCATKDELDNTERELIEKYDAFRSGYNGTGGNK